MFMSTQIPLKPPPVAARHLDLSAHFEQPPKLDFQKQVHGSGWTPQLQRSWKQADSGGQNEWAPLFNAHLQAVGEVVRRRKEDARAALRQNAALASYALPIQLLVREDRLPEWLQNARNDLHLSLTQMADLTHAAAKQQLDTFDQINARSKLGWPLVLGQTHPRIAQDVKKLIDALVTHGRTGIAQFKSNLTQTPQITPDLTARTVDTLIGVALLGITKKINAPQTKLDVEKIPIKNSKTVHQVKGTQTRLTLQPEPKGDRLYFNLRDLTISIHPEKNAAALALLTQTLRENSGMVKLISINLRGTSGAQRTELLASNSKPILSGFFKDTPIGKLLIEEGYTGKVKMVPKTTKNKDQKTVTYLEVHFTRT